VSIRALQLCPAKGCLRPVWTALDDESTKSVCTHCAHAHQFEPGQVRDGNLLGCPYCSSSELYRQRDFNQTLGCAVMVVAGVASVVVNQITRDWWWLVVLAVGVAIDAVLYKILPDRAGCYVCHAEFRDVPNLEAIKPYDLHDASRIEYAGPKKSWPEGVPQPPSAAADPESEG
jgi:hypothetical protein